jgi:hypothetical protein
MSGAWPWGLAGGLVGIINGLSRWKTVSRLSATAVSGSLRLTIGTMVLRLGLVAGLLATGLKQGIIPGLSAFAGLCIARWIVVLWFGTRKGSADRWSVQQLRSRG